MRPTTVLLVAAALAATPASAREVWERAEPALRKLGVEFVVCKDNPEEVLCLGLRCAAGSSELVSMRSASGAFVGKVRLSASGKEIDLQFSDYDPRFMKVVGASGSAAKVAPETIAAILAARRVTIVDDKEGRFSESYATAGLAGLLNASKACR